MKENLKIIKEKEKEYISKKMEIDMKEKLKIIKEMEKENFIIIMEIDMKEIIKMVKKMEKEYFITVIVGIEPPLYRASNFFFEGGFYSDY